MKATPSIQFTHTSSCFRVPSNTLTKRWTSKRILPSPRLKGSLSIEQRRQSRLSFENYAKRNNLSPADLVQVKSEMLDEETSRVLKKFKGSMYRTLSTLFPEIQWKPWQFNERVPRHYWSKESNQRKFFDDLGQKIGIQTLDDWYSKLSRKLIEDNGGTGMLLNSYSGSPSAALMAVYYEHNWLPWKFKSVAMGFWKNIDNQRKFFDWLGKQLGVQTLDDWPVVLATNTREYEKILDECGGRGVVGIYGSVMSALKAVYPHHNFPQTIIAARVELKHQQKLDDTNELKANFIAKNLTEEEWYQVSPSSLDPASLKILQKRFQGYLYSALSTFFPEIPWCAWKFKQQQVPRSYWTLENQRKFFDELAKTLGIEKPDDWYQKLHGTIIEQHGGKTIVNRYNGSLLLMLKAVYPEHKWIPWKFETVPLGFWSSKENVKQYLTDLSEKLSIQTLDDWYRVDFVLFKKYKGGRLLTTYKGLYNLLKEHYPHHPWDPKRFQLRGKKTQRWLAVNLKKMFPDEEIVEDFTHPRATLAGSNRPLQLDVYIPSRSLAFEYQGIQHYEDIGVFSPTRTYQQRDEEKRTLCAANNIKLIEVPYWWNRTQEELQEFINQSQLYS